MTKDEFHSLQNELARIKVSQVRLLGASNQCWSRVGRGASIH
jgi:hypothetical protein